MIGVKGLHLDCFRLITNLIYVCVDVSNYKAHDDPHCYILCAYVLN